MTQLARRHLARALGLAGLCCLASAAPGAACSICRCGDVTFNALGKEGYTRPGFRAAVDWERFDKEEGDPAQETESMVENRVTALAAYGLGDRLLLTARLPFSRRELTSSAAGEAPEKTRTSGLSDPEVMGQVRLWSSPLSSLGRRTSVSLTAGVKAPWGENAAQQEASRVDEHAQPGTGSTDVFASVALLRLLDARSALFVSGGYRHSGDNDYGYRYGSAWMANVAVEHKLSARLDGTAELDFRQADKDRVDAQGTRGPDTGGALLYVAPRLLVDLGQGVVLRIGAQIPVVRDLNGSQRERAVWSAGVTQVLAR